jgi:GH25 family lysozyme M1 (1,4-beta-N-acetylmuramidase)
MQTAFNQFKKKRAQELDTLIQKHKNKMKDIDLSHKNGLIDMNRLKTSASKTMSTFL